MTNTRNVAVELELLEHRVVVYFILPIREIRGITLTWHRHVIALQVHAVQAEILEIERVFLLSIRVIGVAHQTNYDKILSGADTNVVDV